MPTTIIVPAAPTAGISVHPDGLAEHSAVSCQIRSADPIQMKLIHFLAAKYRGGRHLAKRDRAHGSRTPSFLRFPDIFHVAGEIPSTVSRRLQNDGFIQFTTGSL
jgi:hypothetical protein